jgi:predicted membrane-bound spermidine synthase
VSAAAGDEDLISIVIIEIPKSELWKTTILVRDDDDDDLDTNGKLQICVRRHHRYQL